MAKESFTDLFLSFHRNPTIIPRTTLATREAENKAMNIFSDKINSKMLTNNIVEFSSQFY
jgi:hypothetical protein